MTTKSSLGALCQSRPCLRCERGKGGCVVRCQFCQHLAIEFNARLLESVDELAVAHAIQFGGGVDAHDPDRAILALLLLAPGVGELQPALHTLFGAAIEL